MVEVRFACISSVAGVKCTLDGATKYSDSSGLASFYGISQGAHSYSIKAPEGMMFVSGDDVFGRPLYESGITVIEWLPYPEIPWPENQPWMLKFVFEEIPVGISTTTTLSAPGKIGVSEKFNISGILYETESGIPIPTQPINHSYNGRSLGGSTTGVDGDYLKEVSIPESGVWTIKSEFPGTPGYAASRSVAGTMVAASPLEAAIKIAGSVAAGLALIIYSLS